MYVISFELYASDLNYKVQRNFTLELKVQVGRFVLIELELNQSYTSKVTSRKLIIV